MKRRLVSIVLSFSIIIAALFSLNVPAAFADDSGNCGASKTVLGPAQNNATYTYSSATKTLTIQGTGATKDYGDTSSNGRPWDKYKSEITKVVVKEGITELGTLNFYNFTALTSVSLPSSLTTISGSTANYGVFRGCTALKSITLPEGLTTIEPMAFRDCTALESIRLPNTLTTLGNYAFRDCTALLSVTYGTGMTSTGSYAFYDCSNLNTVVFSSTITSIDSYSFYGTRITSIELPETIENIGTRAFANCTFLSEITVYNANCVFGGLESGKGPFDGTTQVLTMYGHKGSTTETFANSKGYIFVSIDPCDHAETHEVIKLQPTCTEKGITTQVCDECGAEVSKSDIPAIQHNWVITTTENQVDTDGHIYKLYVCTNENCFEEKMVVEHVEFVEGNYTYTKEGNCTIGYEKKTCLTEGCGKVERTPLIGGNHQVDKYTVISEPDCVNAGSEEGVCSACGKTVTNTIPATGHDNVLIDSYESIETDGHTYEVYKCNTCQDETTVLTHIEWMEDNYTSNTILAPGCLYSGVRQDVCDTCGEKRNVTLPAAGEHNYVEVEGSRIEPTCTAVGKIFYACENEGCNSTKSENIPALEHDYVVQDDASEPPTCVNPGYVTKKCSVCSAVTKDVLLATGHTVDETQYTIFEEASCEEDGSAQSVCTVCGETFDIVLTAFGHNYEDVETELEDKPGHNYIIPVCTRCEYEDAVNAGIVHKEWIEGYYTTEVRVAGSCLISRVTRDTCTICNEHKDTTTPAAGHQYKYTRMENNGTMVYVCDACKQNETRQPQTLSTTFPPYINKNTDEITFGYRYDLNLDGIVNAKDYAIINKALIKAQAYQ